MMRALDRWRPEPEWEEWIDDWYPSGSDTTPAAQTPPLA